MTCETLLEDYLQDALDLVSAWDLPDEELPDAVNAQARLMAGIAPEYLSVPPMPSAYLPLPSCTNPYLTLQF